MERSIETIASCTVDTCPLWTSPYGYQPNQGINALFMAIFASALLGNMVFVCTERRWVAFGAPLTLACLLEIVGYGVRVGTSLQPWNMSFFATTEVVLAIAPSFIAIAIHPTVEKILLILGKEHSLVDVRIYARMIWVEIAGIILQIIGFAVAIANFSKISGLSTAANKGGYIVAVGLAFHAVALGFFFVLFTVALVKAYSTYRRFGYASLDPETGHRILSKRFKIFVLIVFAAVVCLLIRALYRVAGFAQEFDKGSRSQGFFAMCDGLMVAEAVLGLAVSHPAHVLILDGRDGLKSPGRPVSQTSKFSCGSNEMAFGAIQKPVSYRSHDTASYQEQGETNYGGYEATSYRSHDEAIYHGHDAASYRDQDTTSLRNQDAASFRSHDAASNRNHDAASYRAHNVASHRSHDAASFQSHELDSREIHEQASHKSHAAPSVRSIRTTSSRYTTQETMGPRSRDPTVYGSQAMGGYEVQEIIADYESHEMPGDTIQHPGSFRSQGQGSFRSQGQASLGSQHQAPVDYRSQGPVPDSGFF